MREVGVSEAKAQLTRLLAQVRRGERITITRYGVPIAELVPPAGGRTAPVEDVIAEIKRFRKARSLGRTSLRAMIRQGGR